MKLIMEGSDCEGVTAIKVENPGKQMNANWDRTKFFINDEEIECLANTNSGTRGYFQQVCQWYSIPLMGDHSPFEYPGRVRFLTEFKVPKDVKKIDYGFWIKLIHYSRDGEHAICSIGREGDAGVNIVDTPLNCIECSREIRGLPRRDLRKP